MRLESKLASRKVTMRILIVILTTVFSFSVASAQNNQGFLIGLGLGGAEFNEDLTGFFGFTGGYAAQWNSFILNADLEIDMIPAEGDSRFSYDSSVDRCRDSTTGRFAKDSECSAVDLRFALTADADYYLGKSNVYFGAGYRVGSAASPYVSLGFLRGPLDNSAIHLKAMLWPSLISLRVLWYFPRK